MTSFGGPGTQSSRRKRSGRKQRIESRTAPELAINPAPPGQRGGAYKPLADSDLETIVASAFRLLDDLGMAEVPEILEKQCLAKGARINTRPNIGTTRNQTLCEYSATPIAPPTKIQT